MPKGLHNLCLSRFIIKVDIFICVHRYTAVIALTFYCFQNVLNDLELPLTQKVNMVYVIQIIRALTFTCSILFF